MTLHTMANLYQFLSRHNRWILMLDCHSEKKYIIKYANMIVEHVLIGHLLDGITGQNW